MRSDVVVGYLQCDGWRGEILDIRITPTGIILHASIWARGHLHAPIQVLTPNKVIVVESTMMLDVDAGQGAYVDLDYRLDITNLTTMDGSIEAKERNKSMEEFT